MEAGNDLDEILGGLAGEVIVTPGEEITRGSGFLRGHGTYVERGDGPDEDPGEGLGEITVSDDYDAEEGGSEGKELKQHIA